MGMRTSGAEIGVGRGVGVLYVDETWRVMLAWVGILKSMVNSISKFPP